MVTAIILAAGNSTRYGQNRNKNFEKVHGKYIIEYSLEQFNKNEKINNIIIVAKMDEIVIVNKVLKGMKLKKEVKVIIGGKERKDSVYNGISQTKSEIVIIHDAARPLIKQKYINDCIEETKKYKGVSIAVKSKDTIKVTDDKGIVISTTKRRNTWNIQTPQCFDRKTLIDSYNKLNNEKEMTDDCMVLEENGYEVKLINGDYSNIKITTFDDMHVIKRMIETYINKS